MKYFPTFESFMNSLNEGDLFKTTETPQQAAATNIRNSLIKIEDLKQKMSEKPEEALYLRAQIDIEKEKIDVLKAQIRADSAKQTLAARKEFEKKQKEYEKNKAKPDKPKK